jgi:ssDNA-binding Zn-finger/Zn-ribbon topoisomerase 1
MSKKHTCNQCGKQLDIFELRQKITLGIYVCCNPACPNFSLVQIPVEDMPKEKKNG